MKIRKLLLSLGVFLMTPAFCHAENNDISKTSQHANIL